MEHALPSRWVSGGAGASGSRGAPPLRLHARLHEHASPFVHADGTWDPAVATDRLQAIARGHDFRLGLRRQAWRTIVGTVVLPAGPPAATSPDPRAAFEASGALTVIVGLARLAARTGGAQQLERLSAMETAIYTTDAAGRLTFYNRAAAELWGWAPPLGDQLWCGAWRLFWPSGVRLPHDECPMALCLKEDRDIRGVWALSEQPDGTRVPFAPHPTPLHEDDGRLIGAVNALVRLA